MAKKPKEKKKNKKSEEDKEEISEDEEPDLEEKIEDEENIIDRDKFQEFMQESVQSKTATLGQIAVAPQIVTLEQGVSNAPTPQTKQNSEEDSFKYTASQEQKEEKKYIQSSSTMQTAPEQINIAEVGRQRQDSLQHIGMTQSSELKEIQSPNIEKYTAAERIDPIQAGRKDPLAREERKYTPKLP